MLRCHFCDADLNDVLLQAGRCPRCGGMLVWEAGEDVENELEVIREHARRTLEEATLPSARDRSGRSDVPFPSRPETSQLPVEADDAPQIELPAGTIDDSMTDGDETAERLSATLEYQPPGAETPLRADADSHSGDTVELRKSDPAKQTPADDVLSTVDEIWKGTFDPKITPMMTIRTEVEAIATEHSLVIQPRVVTHTEAPGATRSDYELLQTIGQGGVGVVYAARQASIDRTVALKMLRVGTKADRAQQEKFLSEAVVTGELEHPNIVPIYDLGSSEGGALFYSMKRVQGTPWNEAIDSKPLEANLEVLMKVCDAVAFAHSRGVVHRDLKPENVMLGEFGEVLVMDWGIALSSTLMPKGAGIRKSATMGGTPAYMAPEMATGPLDAIGPQSDVYLLGGILFEIVTGKTPHHGKDILSCLHAAARNQIQPTDKSGELLAIAMRAMATDSSARHRSVPEFQQALREYQSHSESVVLSNHAADDLERARTSADYQAFSRALYGFEEALALWEGNSSARQGRLSARLAYAQCAQEKGDYELGASLLDDRDPQHVKLKHELIEAQRERDARQSRIQSLKRLAVGLVISFCVMGTFAFREIVDQRNTAETERQNALTAAQRANEAAEDALTAESAAKTAKAEAEAEMHAAMVARASETRARQEEAHAHREAEQARRDEEYQRYIAQIGLAAERISGNAFEHAVELLDQYDNSPFRHWEWARLEYLSAQRVDMVEADTAIGAVAVSPSGAQFATGSQSGKLTLWDAQTRAPLAALELGTEIVGLDFAPDGRHLAAATGGPNLLVIQTGETQTALSLSNTLTGHEDALTSVQFSPDGNSLLSASLDNTARIWNAQTGQTRQVLRGHSWWVRQARFSADGKRVVTAGQDGRVVVWSSDEGTRVAEFHEHAGPVHAAVFSPDGELVASAGAGKQVLVWKPADVPPVDLKALVDGAPRPKAPFQVLQGHTAAVHALDFSPTSRVPVVASASDDNTVRLWDVQTGTAIKSLRGHSGRVRSCEFAPGGDALLSGSHDARAKIWDVAGYEEVRVLRSRLLTGHDDAVLAARFSPDGTRVVTASRDQTARIWDVQKGNALKTLREGHEYLGTTVVLFPDGQRLLTAAGDGTVRVWRLDTGAQQLVLSGTGRSAAAAVSADGRFILTGAAVIGQNAGEPADGSQGIVLWDAHTGERLREYNDHPASVSTVAISPSADWLYSGDSEGGGRLWNRATGESLKLLGHTRTVTAASFLPGGGGLLTASGDHTVMKWEIGSQTPHNTLTLTHPDWVNALAVSPGADHVLTSCEDGYVRLWDIRSGTLLDQIDESANIPTAVALSPDGTRVAVIGDDARLRICDAETGDERLALPNRGDWLYSVSYSPDGRHLALAGSRPDVELLDAATGEVVATFAGHAGRVSQAAFSPDGELLASAGWDGTVRLWNVSGHEQLQVLTGHEGIVTAVAFTSDGRRLASAGVDGTVRVWHTNSDDPPRVLRYDGPVRALACHPDSRLVAYAGDSGTIAVSSIAGDTVARLGGDGGPVTALAYAPDGRLAAGGADRAIRIWDESRDQPTAQLQVHGGTIRTLAFSNDAGRWVSAAADQTVRIWESGQQRPARTIELPRGHRHTTVSYDEDGTHALMASANERLFRILQSRDESLDIVNVVPADGGPLWSATLLPQATRAVSIGGREAKLWDLQSGRATMSFSPHGIVSSASFSPDGSRVVTGSWDLSARIWNVESGRVERKLLGGHTGYVNSAVFSPDGRLVLTSSDDGTARLWSAQSGELRPEVFGGHAGPVYAAEISRTGERLATVSADGTARIWTADGRLTSTLTAGEPLFSCAFSPREDRLITGGASGATIWNLESGQAIWSLRGHTAEVNAVAFSPDGRRALTGSRDFTAKVWDTQTGKEVLTLAGHRDEVTAVEFSRSGRTVLTSSKDGTAILWLAEHVAPTIGLSPTAMQYTSGDPPAPIDDSAWLCAPTTDRMEGATLTVALQAAESPSGTLGLQPEPQSHLKISDGRLLRTDPDGTAQLAIGTVAGLGSSRLVLSFNAAADPAAVESVLRSLTFVTHENLQQPQVRHVRLSLAESAASAPRRVTKEIQLLPAREAFAVSHADAPAGQAAATETTPEAGSTDEAAASPAEAPVQSPLLISPANQTPADAPPSSPNDSHR